MERTIETRPTAPARAGPAGLWQGTGQVLVSWVDEPTLAIDLEITPGGAVTGSLGTADFRGRLVANEGRAPDRRVDLWAEWIVAGGLRGELLPKGPIVRRRAVLALTLRGGALRGSLSTDGTPWGGPAGGVVTVGGIRLAQPPRAPLQSSRK